MTDEISLGGKRNILLPFIFLSVVYVLLKILSIKISLWILVAVAIVAILFIVLSSKLKSFAPSTAKTAEESLSSAGFQKLKTSLIDWIWIIGALIVLRWSVLNLWEHWHGS